MSILVSSNSSPMLLQSSRKEEINPPSVNCNSNDSVVINDSLLLSRYAATLHYLEENELKVVPALYHHKHQKNLHSIEGGSAVEEEDTESEEDDDEDHLPSRVASALNENRETNLIEQGIKTPLISSDVPIKSVAAASFLNRTPLSSSISHPVLPPIQTYSPQLNFSLYSPCSTPIASIRSGISKNNYRAYSTSSALDSPSCLSDTSITVQNPTTTKNLSSLSFNNQQRPIYLTSSSSFASTIKMDIRSPPQPSQSTSRFMNAFQRFRSSSINQNKNHSTSSVAPAEIINSIKPSPSKSSLADKIKTKFQQLDKKKKSSVLDSSNNHNSFTTRNNSTKSNNKKKNSSEKTPTFSMPRSASISSITNWSSRLTANNNSSKSKPLGSTAKQQNRLSKSTSLTSFLSSKTHHSLKPSISSSSSSSCSSSESILPTTINTNAPLSLTKSISSHRLYNKNTSSSNNSDSDRPRQPLRAVNPNDSVRLARHSFQSQQRQQKKKGGSKTSVRFTKLVSVRETYSKSDYDRGSDPEAVCTRLTPAMAQHIKEELNAYKLHEMQVHEFSRVHTHFFL